MDIMSRFPLPKIIGHRGASGYAPENTLTSMLYAYEMGVRCVEFDVMLSQDAVPIIMHDITLDRTTDGHGMVAEHKFKQLETLDAGSWFGNEFIGEKIPSFAELLQLLLELRMAINVEIKPTPGQEIITTEKTLDLLARHWPESHLPCLVSSGSLLALQHAHSLKTEFPLGWITDDWPDAWEKTLTDLGAVSLHVNHAALTQERVAAVKKAGYWVLSYTVNEDALAETLFSWGVDAIFTDVPDVILPPA